MRFAVRNKLQLSDLYLLRILADGPVGRQANPELNGQFPSKRNVRKSGDGVPWWESHGRTVIIASRVVSTLQFHSNKPANLIPWLVQRLF